MAAGTYRPRFGTDGLRGPFGSPPMDEDTLGRVAAALGVWLQRSGTETKRVLIGQDGRRSGRYVLDILADGLAAAEVVPIDVGLLTTPALSHLVRTDSGATAGVMISASHNPAGDNGIKIFGGDGSKLSDDDERGIEELCLRTEFEPRGTRAKPRRELIARYEEHLRSAFPDLDLGGMRIAVDAANGGGSVLLPRLLTDFGAEVVAAIGCSPDGDNINDGVGALHPERLAQATLEHRADFGICLDGDGDRGIFVDERGTVRDGDDVLATLAPHLRDRGRLPNDVVVATVMSNLAMHRRLQRSGIRVHTTAVGDRYVVQAMRQGGYGLGGEQSGHVIFAGAGHFTGDGLFTALQLLALPSVRERGFAATFGDMPRYPQVLINVRVVDAKPPLADCAAVQAAVQEVQAALGDDGRVLLRYSGTEPLCRVMVEGPERDSVQRHADHIAAAVRAAIGA